MFAVRQAAAGFSCPLIKSIMTQGFVLAPSTFIVALFFFKLLNQIRFECCQRTNSELLTTDPHFMTFPSDTHTHTQQSCEEKVLKGLELGIS